MSRQSNPERTDRKNDVQRKDMQRPENPRAGSARENRERSRRDALRVSGMDRYRLNDLYERSY